MNSRLKGIQKELTRMVKEHCDANSTGKVTVRVNIHRGIVNRNFQIGFERTYTGATPAKRGLDRDSGMT